MCSYHRNFHLFLARNRVEGESFNICEVVQDICPMADSATGHCEAMVPPTEFKKAQVQYKMR